MDFVDLEPLGLNFKELLSGPAQVGKIMSYVIIAQDNGLYYDPRSKGRNTKHRDQIGYGWIVKYMIGLSLLRQGLPVADSIYSLEYFVEHNARFLGLKSAQQA